MPNVPYDTIDAANQLKSPRLLKSHLPAMLLPKAIWTKKPKVTINVICVAIPPVKDSITLSDNLRFSQSQRRCSLILSSLAGHGGLQRH